MVAGLSHARAEAGTNVQLAWTATTQQNHHYPSSQICEVPGNALRKNPHLHEWLKPTCLGQPALARQPAGRQQGLDLYAGFSMIRHRRPGPTGGCPSRRSCTAMEKFTTLTGVAAPLDRKSTRLNSSH